MDKLINNALNLYLGMVAYQKAAYEAGYDCGLNGPNTTNCHASYFSTVDSKDCWEQGKKDAKAGLPNQFTK